MIAIKNNLSNAITVEWWHEADRTLLWWNSFEDSEGNLHNIAIIPKWMFDNNIIRPNKSGNATLYFTYKPWTAYRLPETKIECEVVSDIRDDIEVTGTAYYTRHLIGSSTELNPVELLQFIINDREQGSSLNPYVIIFWIIIFLLLIIL